MRTGQQKKGEKRDFLLSAQSDSWRELGSPLNNGKLYISVS